MSRYLAAASILSAIVAGCGKTPPEPLSPQAFRNQQEQAAIAQLPATNPTTVMTTSSASSGQSLTLGTVIAEANGTPIYANKVLAKVEKPLEEKARQLESNKFRDFATDLIKRAVMEEINDELEFAAAQRNLSEEDRALAQGLTMQWRQKKITEAGGALSVAKDQMMKTDGLDFDEAVQRQYRIFHILIYHERKIRPRVQVSAADMRRYYDSNLDKVFTEHAAISFRLIKIDWDRSGTKDEATNKAASLLKRVKDGEDFAAVAGESNDDEFLKTHGGQPSAEPIQKGSYKDSELEAEIWKLQPGQITDAPIVSGKAFFIAKVESQKIGRVVPFDEEKTQDAIRNNLRSAQMSKLRKDEQQKLWNSAFMKFDEAMMQPAVDMAMQKYVIWTTKS